MDCASHDADYSRTDRSTWYRDATFEVASLFNRVVNETYAQSAMAARAEDIAMCCAGEEGSERAAMCICDVNFNL